MRLYPVPFTTQGEEKLIFNLTIKQVLVIGLGSIVGFTAMTILSKILGVLMLYCLPVMLPFLGISIFLALAKKNKSGRSLELGEYVFLKFCYKHQPKHYLRFRERSF
jgi:hypothetical protein